MPQAGTGQHTLVAQNVCTKCLHSVTAHHSLPQAIGETHGSVSHVPLSPRIGRSNQLPPAHPNWPVERQVAGRSWSHGNINCIRWIPGSPGVTQGQTAAARGSAAPAAHCTPPRPQTAPSPPPTSCVLRYIPLPAAHSMLLRAGLALGGLARLCHQASVPWLHSTPSTARSAPSTDAHLGSKDLLTRTLTLGVLVRRRAMQWLSPAKHEIHILEKQALAAALYVRMLYVHLCGMPLLATGACSMTAPEMGGGSLVQSRL